MPKYDVEIALMVKTEVFGGRSLDCTNEPPGDRCHQENGYLLFLYFCRSKVKDEPPFWK